MGPTGSSSDDRGGERRGALVNELPEESEGPNVTQQAAENPALLLQKKTIAPAQTHFGARTSSPQRKSQKTLPLVALS